MAQWVAWGSVVGSALQFGVQLPTVLRLVKRLRPMLEVKSKNVRTVIRNFFPVFVSRGVVQISAFVDALLASLLGTGAVAALTFAQSLYTLPVSLFGMSVSAAELPQMSSALGTDEEVKAQLRRRLDAGLRQIAFFIVPSAIGFLLLGDVMAGALYQTGRFTRADSVYVWGILAGSAVGLLPTTLGRLYASTYYALHDTRTPLRYAIVHVVVAVVLGYVLAIPVPSALGIDLRWGAIGLDDGGGPRRLGRIFSPQADAQRQDRADGIARALRLQAVGGGARGGRARLGHQALRRRQPPRVDGHLRPGALRGLLFRTDLPAGLARGRGDFRQI